MDDQPQTPANETAAVSGPRPLKGLLKDSLRLARERLGTYAAIVILGLAPGFVLVGLAMQAMGYTGEGSIRAAVYAGQYGDVGWLLSVGLLGAAFKGLAFLALSLAVLARLGGEDIGIGKAFGRAVGFIVPMVVTEALAFVFIIGGLCLLIVPGVVLAIRYALAPWAVLVEGRSGRDALRRSKELMLAHMGKVVGNLFVSALIVIVTATAIAFAVLVVLSLAGLVQPEPRALWNTLTLNFIVDVIRQTVGVWGFIFAILLYKDLAALHPAEAGVEAGAPVPKTATES
jgi:hypothetical protein